MISKVIIVLVSLLSLSRAISCPTFSCNDSLRKNVCGKRETDTSFLINSHGCDSGFQCFSTGFWSWATLADSSSFPCVPVPSFPKPETRWSYATCPVFQPNKSFQNGKSLVTCVSDADCLLADGSFTTCQCSFRSDGVGVCKPDPNNFSVFAGYWEECGTTGQITNEYAYLYWTWVFRYWVDSQSDLSCNFNFSEMQMLNILHTAYVNGTLPDSWKP